LYIYFILSSSRFPAKLRLHRALFFALEFRSHAHRALSSLPDAVPLLLESELLVSGHPDAGVGWPCTSRWVTTAATAAPGAESGAVSQGRAKVPKPGLKIARQLPLTSTLAPVIIMTNIKCDTSNPLQDISNNKKANAARDLVAIIRKGKWEEFLSLLETKPNTDWNTFVSGNTALHYCLMLGMSSSCLLFLSLAAGPDPLIRPVDVLTILTHALPSLSLLHQVVMFHGASSW
jgi:hypothetical protein